MRLGAADAQVRSGDYAGAAMNAQRAVELGANTDARYLLAVTNRLGDAAGALAALEKTADRAAASPGEIAERAWARWRLGDPPGAAAERRERWRRSRRSRSPSPCAARSGWWRTTSPAPSPT